MPKHRTWSQTQHAICNRERTQLLNDFVAGINEAGARALAGLDARTTRTRTGRLASATIIERRTATGTTTVTYPVHPAGHMFGGIR